MKRSPEMQRLEEVLRSSKLVAGGFLGDDPRPLEEIVEADAKEVAETGHDLVEFAEKMREITAKAKKGLGTPVKLGEKIQAQASDTRGDLVCPWPHPGKYSKVLTTVRDTESGKIVRWSELSIHMIEAHGFFEGKGSQYRLEPKEVADIIFKSDFT
jgi:hypothetical protein